MSHVFKKFAIPLVKIALFFLNSVWQVNASFKKGARPQGSDKTKKNPPINKRWLPITG